MPNTGFPITEITSITAAPSFGASTPDVAWNVARRHPSLGVIIGGQTQFTITDRGVWIESNAHTPHESDIYSGYWGFMPPPSRTVPSGLIVAPLWGDDGTIATVPDGIAITATWGMANIDTTGRIVWHWKLTDAVSGVTVDSGTVDSTILSDPLQRFSAAIGSLSAGSYLLWVNRYWGEKAYVWPADYLAVTGQTSVPSFFTWTHPVLGPLQYDPYYNVGAIPYDSTDPRQADLLALHADAIENGLLRKYAPWVNDLITFDGSGTQVSPEGEYACIPVLAGAGSFVSFDSVHLSATPGPALWKYAGSSLSPWMLDPRLRTVAALDVDETDLTLRIGGALAGRDGPMPCLLFYTGGPTYTGESSTITFLCDCARIESLAINSIQKDSAGMIYAVSACDRFVLDKGQLVASHPGGRALSKVRNPDGSTSLYCATENDFASSELFTPALAYCVDVDRKHPGEGIAKLLHSCLAAYAGRLWGITETSSVPGKLSFQLTLAQRDASTQSLCYFDGTHWVPVSTWTVGTFDASRLGQCGKYLLVFGLDSTKAPRALRVGQGLSTNTVKIESGIILDRHVWRCEPSPMDATADWRQETLLMVCPTGAQPDISGWSVSEPNNGGAPVHFCGFWNDTDQAFEFDQAALVAAGFDPNELPLFLTWNAAKFGWNQSSTAPVDATPYLEKRFIAGPPADIVQYHLHSGSMPYDVTQYSRICFNLLGDGSGGIDPLILIDPEPGCTTPDCVIGGMPPGTTVEAFNYVGPVASLIASDPAHYAEGSAISRLYPNIWITTDRDITITGTADPQLAENYWQYIHYGREEYLPTPALRKVTVVILKPPLLDGNPTTLDVSLDVMR